MKKAVYLDSCECVSPLFTHHGIYEVAGTHSARRGCILLVTDEYERVLSCICGLSACGSQPHKARFLVTGGHSDEEWSKCQQDGMVIHYGDISKSKDKWRNSEAHRYEGGAREHRRVV